MTHREKQYLDWLNRWMREHDIAVWGTADLSEFETPTDLSGAGYRYAISWALPVDPLIMARVKDGPNPAYVDEYARLNDTLNELAGNLAAAIVQKGFRAQPLAASKRTDPVNIKGDFPHKTAATRAGIGWVGRHCQIITKKFGSWVRLGTVFTDMRLPAGPPINRNFCGACTRCVDACPAGALQGTGWKPGLERHLIVDVKACDAWKKKLYSHYHKGHICGICSAVCPHSTKILKRFSGDRESMQRSKP